METLTPDAAKGLTSWEKACLSRAVAHLRQSALQPDFSDLSRPSPKMARLRALEWLCIAALDPVRSDPSPICDTLLGRRDPETRLAKEAQDED